MRTKSENTFFGYLKVEVAYFKADMIFWRGANPQRGAPLFGGEAKKSFQQDPISPSLSFQAILFLFFIIQFPLVKIVIFMGFGHRRAAGFAEQPFLFLIPSSTIQGTFCDFQLATSKLY